MGITHAFVNAKPDGAATGRTQPSDWNAAHVGNGLGMFNAKDYGATGDGATDDFTALQACLTAAWNAPGGTMFLPPGEYLTSAALTSPTTAGAVRVQGGGRTLVAKNPAAVTGASIRTTSTTANVFTFGIASGQRHSITIESLNVIGNASGTTGHAIHFSAPFSAGAQYVTLRDVRVSLAAEHGIFFDGNVFESQLINVRADQCVGSGFKAAGNNGGIPGETRMYGCTFDFNDIGIDLAGGGSWSLHGVTATENEHEGIKATAVFLRCFDVQLETNSQADLAGNKMTITNCFMPQFYGIVCTGWVDETGIGLAFVSCTAPIVSGFYTNTLSNVGAGYRDLSFDTSSRGTLDGYWPGGSAGERLELGTLGRHVIRRGGEHLTSRNHPVQTVSSSSTGTDTMDADRYDTLLSRRTAASITRTIAWPSPWAAAVAHEGQRVTVLVWNDSAGTTTTAWNGVWHLAGSWVDPAAGKVRSITFEFNSTINGYVETSRSVADMDS